MSNRVFVGHIVEFEDHSGHYEKQFAELADRGNARLRELEQTGFRCHHLSLEHGKTQVIVVGIELPQNTIFRDVHAYGHAVSENLQAAMDELAAELGVEAARVVGEGRMKSAFGVLVFPGA